MGGQGDKSNSAYTANATGLTTTNYVAGGGYKVATTSAGTKTAKLYIGASAVVARDIERTPLTAYNPTVADWPQSAIHRSRWKSSPTQ